jgi:hypothetical protein
MSPGDHEEMLRLRDRLHEVANTCAKQYAEIQLLCHDLKTAQKVTQNDVEHLSHKVGGLERAVWTLVGTVLAGVIVYLLTQALGARP